MLDLEGAIGLATIIAIPDVRAKANGIDAEEGLDPRFVRAVAGVLLRVQAETLEEAGEACRIIILEAYPQVEGAKQVEPYTARHMLSRLSGLETK